MQVEFTDSLEQDADVIATVIHESDDGQLQVCRFEDMPGRYFIVGSDGSVFPVWTDEIVDFGVCASEIHKDYRARQTDGASKHVCRENSEPLGPPRHETTENGDDIVVVPAVCTVCDNDLDVNYVPCWSDESDL